MTRIDDPGFEHLCLELGLEDIIIPSLTIGRYLADMFEGRDHLEIIALIKGDARVFSFVARAEDEKPISELALPEDSRVLFFYRNDRFALPDPGAHLKCGDEVMIVTRSRNLETLHARWGRPPEKKPGTDQDVPPNDRRGKGYDADHNGKATAMKRLPVISWLYRRVSGGGGRVTNAAQSTRFPDITRLADNTLCNLPSRWD